MKYYNYFLITFLSLIFLSPSFAVNKEAKIPRAKQKVLYKQKYKKDKPGLFRTIKSLKKWKKASDFGDQEGSFSHDLNKRANRLLALAIISFLVLPWGLIFGVISGNWIIWLFVALLGLGALFVDIESIRMLSKNRDAPQNVRYKLIWALVLALLAGLTPLITLLIAINS